VLHDQEVDAARLIRILVGDDIGMAQFGGRLNLAMESLVAAKSFVIAAGNTFTATILCMTLCRALQTLPMPPAPILSRIV
jgi:hypothetical protein